MSPQGELIYRPVESEDLPTIVDAQKRLDRLRSFRSQSMPHLTLLGRSATRGFNDNRMDAVTYPLPPTADETVAFPVEGLRVHRYRQSIAHYVLMLGDVDGVYHDEHHRFSQKSRRRVGSIVLHVPPHVTLGSVDAVHALDVDEEEVLSRVPKVLHFGPIRSTHESTRQRTISGNRAPKREHTRTYTANVPVQTIRPNSIPPLFLRSLGGGTME